MHLLACQRREEAWGGWAAGGLLVRSFRSQRVLPMSEAIQRLLADFGAAAGRHGELVFATTKGTPYSDSDLLRRMLKPVGARLGMPWLNWHTLRRTHATLIQQAGASLKDAQAQLGHAKMSTTLELYTMPIPVSQRKAVENLAQLLTNVDESPQAGAGRSLQCPRIQ